MWQKLAPKFKQSSPSQEYPAGSVTVAVTPRHDQEGKVATRKLIVDEQ